MREVLATRQPTPEGDLMDDAEFDAATRAAIQASLREMGGAAITQDWQDVGKDGASGEDAKDKKKKSRRQRAKENKVCSCAHFILQMSIKEHGRMCSALPRHRCSFCQGQTCIAWAAVAERRTLRVQKPAWIMLGRQTNRTTPFPAWPSIFEIVSRTESTYCPCMLHTCTLENTYNQVWSACHPLLRAQLVMFGLARCLARPMMKVACMQPAPAPLKTILWLAQPLCPALQFIYE